MEGLRLYPAILPVVAALTLIQWVGVMAVSISTIFFDLAGGIFIVAGILSYAFGQEPMGMMWRMIGTGVFICLLPKIGEWVAAQVVYLNLLVKHWLMS
jgi:hypothetical protein